MTARARKPRAAAAPETRASKATPAELSAYLRRSQGTLANWRSQGKGPRWTKPGGSILYDWADVYAWEDSQPSGGADVRRGAA
jgi:hypothetical protein